MIAFVQSAQNGVFSPASSLSKAFTSPNVAGNFLICAVRVYTGGGGTTTNVTDTNGNTGVKAPGSFVKAGLANVELWYAENCAGGSNTVTLSLPSPFYPKFVIAEYSGVATSS